MIQGHGGVESAEEEQVVSTGDQADDVTTVQGEGEEQDKQTGNEDMPHRTTVEGGQAEVETKQESVSMDTDPGFTDEPVAMEGHSGGGGAPVGGDKQDDKGNNRDNKGPGPRWQSGRRNLSMSLRRWTWARRSWTVCRIRRATEGAARTAQSRWTWRRTWRRTWLEVWLRLMVLT